MSNYMLLEPLSTWFVSLYVYCCHVICRLLLGNVIDLVTPPDRCVIWLDSLPMASSSSSDSSSSDTDCSSDSDSLDNVPRDPWRRIHACTVNHYPVSLRREQDVSRSNASRQRSLQNRRQQFLHEYDFEDADDQSIIDTQEAHDLRVWCTEKSWAFCKKKWQTVFPEASAILSHVVQRP